MSDNTKSNFYKLISNKSIIIPIIQRDYIQGKTTSKISGIRERLIRDMLQSLNKKSKIDFQYIYGIYKEGECFLPIDGQQRLTSMFLFTWGIAIKAGRESATVFANLKKFSYQVREESSDFFRCLLELDDCKKLKHFEDFVSYMRNNDKKFDEFSWFKRKWQSDQTVRSTLVFFDDLRKELENLDENKAKEYLNCILSEECPFEFYLIAQNEIVNDSNKSEKQKQDDAFEAENRAATTYINMNARGKALNEFENFKALLHKCKYKNKCEYENKERMAGKEFIDKYESDYIHTLVKYIEHYQKNNLSLSEKIEKMDEFTLNLLMNIYNDIWKIKHEDKEEQKDVYRFMNFIKENDCECSRIFSEEYFEFVDYVIKRVKPDKGNGILDFDDIFYFYCSNHTYRDKWNFMIQYWCPYRLKKAGIKEDGWNVFCNHLNISYDDGTKQIAYRWCHDATSDKRYILNAILKELDTAKKGTVEEFLEQVNVEDFLQNVCRNPNGNDSLNLTFARIMEEKIKANVYLKEKSNDSECADILDVDSQIRYLLYFAGYYDKNGDYNKNGNYNVLKEYIQQHQNINLEISQPSISWRKAYYMTAVDLSSSPLEPINDIALQCWKNEIRYWKGNVIPKKELDRVKSIFDILIKKEWEISTLINDYQSKCRDISSWLYYLLRRDMVEIINGLITNKTIGYQYLGRNYYEYVLERDLCAKGYVIVSKCMKEATVFLNQISPRLGKDEQTRNRNPIFTIAPYYKAIPNNTMVYQNIWYKFDFCGFDSNNYNEDQFKWMEDQNFDTIISQERSSVVSVIYKEIVSLNNDEVCDLIYQKETDNFLTKLKNLALISGWTIASVTNEGANGVKIKVECFKTPFQNLQPKKINHSEI